MAAATARGVQVRPTKAEIAGAWRRLRDRAGEGDLLAAGLLIALGEVHLMGRFPYDFVKSAEDLGAVIKRRIEELEQ